MSKWNQINCVALMRNFIFALLVISSKYHIRTIIEKLLLFSSNRAFFIFLHCPDESKFTLSTRIYSSNKIVRGWIVLSSGIMSTRICGSLILLLYVWCMWNTYVFTNEVLFFPYSIWLRMERTGFHKFYYIFNFFLMKPLSPNCFCNVMFYSNI